MAARKFKCELSAGHIGNKTYTSAKIVEIWWLLLMSIVTIFLYTFNYLYAVMHFYFYLAHLINFANYECGDLSHGK